MVARSVVRGRSAPLVLIFWQQVFDAVVCVEGIDRADLIWEFLAAFGALAFTFGAGAFGLLCGEAVLFCAALDFLPDGAAFVEAQGCRADDAVLVEYRG